MTTGTLDQQIQLLFSKLNSRKAAVEGLRKEIAKSWKTNGTFRLIGSASTTNIQTATLETIDEIAIQLCMIEAGASAASDILGRPVGAKVQGYSVADWFSDFAKRQATINIREEEKQLAQLEDRLNQVLSPEERRRIEIELLAKEI